MVKGLVSWILNVFFVKSSFHKRDSNDLTAFLPLKPSTVHVRFLSDAMIFIFV